MIIETNRLRLFPLTSDLLQLLLNDPAEFEAQASYRYDGEELSGELYDIFKGQLEVLKAAGENYLWHTFWMIVLKEENTIIGSSCYKGAPKEGSVEIGYGINQSYECKGYMTEAVKGLVTWALQQTGVKEVVAEVDQDNIASHRVCIKSGFQKYKTVNAFDWYRIQQ